MRCLSVIAAVAMLCAAGCDEEDPMADGGDTPDAQATDGGGDGVDANTDAAPPTPDAGPGQVPVTDVTGIAAGQRHACALLSDGTAMCWGSNQSGQLGDGTVESRSLAEAVSELAGASRIAAGGWHTCAHIEGMQCWGYNRFGQLGTASPSDALVPTTTATDGSGGIALARDHSCSVNAMGRASCWGGNQYGQLGTGDTDPLSRPRLVRGGIGDTVAIAVADTHSCMVRESGEARCWGSNIRGQLGTGDTLNTFFPTVVVGITDATAVAAGTLHTCVVHADGGLSCWGANGNQRLGFEGAGIIEPQRIDGITGVVQVVAGNDHTCVRHDTGEVSCWGRNQRGQVGVAPFSAGEAPTLVPGITDAVDIAAGADFTCVARADGGAACWGGNDRGQLGDGSVEDRAEPAPVERLDL